MERNCTGIPLTQEERERLWFVSWDQNSRKFKLDRQGLTIGNTQVLKELIRTGLVEIDLLRKRVVS